MGVKRAPNDHEHEAKKTGNEIAVTLSSGSFRKPEYVPSRDRQLSGPVRIPFLFGECQVKASLPAVHLTPAGNPAIRVVRTPYKVSTTLSFL